MTVYADTSALIKLFVAERGSDEMRRLVQGSTVAVSELTWAEAHATFARRLREGHDPEPAHDAVVARFERAWRQMLRVPLSQPVLRAVPDLCRRHPLRAGDAIQLASALLLAGQGVSITYACNDARLLTAAAAEGLPTFDPVERALTPP